MIVEINVEIHEKGSVQMRISRELIEEVLTTLVQVEDVTWISIVK